MFVKICGITTVEDGLLAAGLGADAIGMVFAASSPRRISVSQAAQILPRLPPEVLTVGVFRNELRDRVVEITDRAGLGAVQLHGHESPEDCRWIAARVPALIKAFSIKDPALQQHADYGPHRLLIDSPLPGSGEVFDWGLLDRLVADRRYILAGGLNPSNVAEAIEMLGPWGVDVSSGVEASPGRKDPVKVRRFLAAARAAAQSIDLWDDDPIIGSPARSVDQALGAVARSSAAPGDPARHHQGAATPGETAGPRDQAAASAAGGPSRPFDWEEDSQWR